MYLANKSTSVLSEQSTSVLSENNNYT